MMLEATIVRMRKGHVNHCSLSMCFVTLQTPVRQGSYLINGQMQPSLGFKTGKMQRLELVHAFGRHVLELSLDTQSCDLLLVSIDGVDIMIPRKVRDVQGLIYRTNSKSDLYTR